MKQAVAEPVPYVSCHDSGIDKGTEKFPSVLNVQLKDDSHRPYGAVGEYEYHPDHERQDEIIIS